MDVETMQQVPSETNTKMEEMVIETIESKITEPARTVSFYAQHLRKKIPTEYFEPTKIRFLWPAGFVIVIAASLYAISLSEVAWFMKLPLSIIVGICYGGLGFFTHELLHGSVIKNRRYQDFFAFIGFMPFFISPTFWRYWHNQLHHGKTQAIIVDPDAFPTMKIFKHSKFMQRMFPYTPGSGHLRSYTYFFFWFTFHVFVAQTYLRFRNSLYDKLQHHRVSLEFTGQVVLWCGFLYFMGPQNLIWTFVIPFMTQNYFVMSYISTNHNLSPLTKVNDPLANSLTVTNQPLLEMLHLNFGYHVEHHIFPTMSGIHTKKVHEVLKADFPETYHYMKKSKAMVALYKTARIYKNTTTLINPETGQTYPTI